MSSSNLIIFKFFLRFIIFFFSSRRRHTRSLCDWSSDVCSSDLENIDLTNWDLQLPIGSAGSPTTISQPQLKNFPERESVVLGKKGDLGGRPIIKKKKKTNKSNEKINIKVIEYKIVYRMDKQIII